MTIKTGTTFWNGWVLSWLKPARLFLGGALIPDHAQLLLKTGIIPIATVMRRELTGYAVSFNHRHRRR